MQKITKLYFLIFLTTVLTPGAVKSQNLLTNGDFESTGGFQSNYNQVTPSGNSNAGDFALVTNSQPMNSANFISSTDHTSGTGKMMVVDGRNNDIFWKQNPNLALQGGSTYQFSYYIKNINASTANQPRILFTPADQCDAACNSSVTLVDGNSDVALMPAGWQKVTYRFTPSGTGNRFIRIELSTINAGLGGNDFAIDDITLTLLPPCPNAPTVNALVFFCYLTPATPLTATASPGNTLLWYTTLTGGVGSTTAPTPSTTVFGSQTDYYVSQTNGVCESPRARIRVLINDNNGSYNLMCDPTQVTMPNSVFFEWSNIPGHIQYYFSYSINGGPAITGNSNNLSHYEVGGLTPGQSVVFTITSVEGAPCVGPATITCTLACTTTVTPVFAGVPSSFCSGSPAPTLPTTSDNGVTGTWSPSTVNSTTGGSYVFTPTTGTLCTNTLTKGITVVTPPSAGTLSGNQTACVGSTTTFTSNVAGGTWVSSNLTVATVNNTTGVITGVAPGTAIMTYSVAGTPPCSNATAIRNVTISAGPNAGTLAGNQTICAGQTSNFTSNGAPGGTWSSSATGIATVNPTTGVVTGVGGGTATISYTVTGTPPCSNAVATRTVTVTPLPSAGTLGGTQNVCVGLTTTFNSNIAGGTWSSSNGAIASINSTTGVITGANPGIATMTYTITGTGGCSNATATRQVTVTAPPSQPALSGNQGVCVGLTTTFNSSIAGGTWTSSAVGIATINPTTGVVTGVTPGIATMTYTLTGTGGCGNVTNTRTATVTAVPSAGNLGGTQNVCVGLTTTFTSDVAGGTWSSSNNAIATINATTGVITGVNPGIATMTYTIAGSGGCGNVTATRQVTVTAPPNPGNLSGSQAICVGLAATYSSTVAGGTWSSSATAIATVNATTGIVTGVAPGVATISYTVNGTGGCNPVAATRQVTVTAAPNAGTISGTSNICLGSTSTLITNGGSGGVWSSSASGIVSVNASGVITGNGVGNATITYKVTGTGGCSDVTATIAATVTAPPNAGTISGSATLCEADTTTYTTTGTGGTWTSSAPAIASINPTTGLITGLVPGNAIMTYKVIGTGGCADAIQTKNITIIARQIPTFTQVAAICEGNALAPLPLISTNGFAGTWSPATMDNTQTTTYTFTPNAGVCSNTTTMTITVIQRVTPVFDPISVQCLNDTNVPVLPLTSQNGISGTWFPATVDLTTLGTKTYNFTANANECVTNVPVSLTISVVAITTPNFPTIAPFCYGKVNVPTLDNISPNGVEGTWNPPVISNTQSGTYVFTPNTVINQCATPQTLNVTVIPKTVPNFAQIAPFCVNTTAPVFSNVSPNGVPGTWNPAVIDNTFVGTQSYEFTPDPGECATNFIMNIVTTPGTDPGFADIVLCKTATPPVLQNVSPSGVNGTWAPTAIDMSLVGTNPYVFTPDAGECGVVQTINVTVNEYTLNNIQGIVSNYFEDDQIITVIAQGQGNYAYQLDYGPLQDSNVFTDVAAGLHTITVVDKNGCGPSMSDPNILVINYPKFFTPNNDGYHDTWNIVGLKDQLDAKIFIFDRYGKLIVQINPSLDGWDGTYNGQELPSTDYWFTVDYHENDVPRQFKAHFSLKR
jgi:gliding motility-associated-like protein